MLGLRGLLERQRTGSKVAGVGRRSIRLEVWPRRQDYRHPRPRYMTDGARSPTPGQWSAMQCVLGRRKQSREDQLQEASSEVSRIPMCRRADSRVSDGSCAGAGWIGAEVVGDGSLTVATQLGVLSCHVELGQRGSAVGLGDLRLARASSETRPELELKFQPKGSKPRKTMRVAA